MKGVSDGVAMKVSLSIFHVEDVERTAVRCRQQRQFQLQERMLKLSRV